MRRVRTDGRWLGLRPGLVVGGALVLASCGSPSQVAQCTVDSNCPAGSVCRGGACQVNLTLSITSPANQTATNGTVQVKVAVGNDQPTSLELQVDGSRLAEVGPPDYSYAWDTRTVAEGPHVLHARVQAGAVFYDSQNDPTVIVKRSTATPTLSVPLLTGAAAVPASGKAEANATVKVYEGTSLLANAAAGADGSWGASLTGLADGSHALTATATDALGNVSPPSAAATVVIDRQPPAVVASGRVPAPGATNVWSRDPISVTFSKPIAPDSVTSDTVKLTNGAGLLQRTASLSANGTVLTLAPSTLPPVPDQLTAVLTDGIRDAAGNALVVPSDPWTWTIPQWEEAAPALVKNLGGNLFFTTAVAPDGSLYVAWRDHVNAASSNLLVQLASGGTLASLGQVYRGGTAQDKACAIVVDGQGRPVVASVESPSTATAPLNVLVSRYDGGSWVPLGGPLNANPAASATSPRLVIGATGEPIAAWLEAVGAVHHVFAKAWNGTSWAALGGETPASATTDVTAFDLASGPAGALSMVFDGTLARYQGTSWTVLTSTLGRVTASEYALAFDAGGGSPVEVLAYAQAGSVQVARWAGIFNGWTPMGNPLSSSAQTPLAHPSLVYRSAGAVGEQLVAGFLETGPRVFGWNGQAWTSLAAAIATQPNPLYVYASTNDLAVGAGGVMSYVWGLSTAPFRVQLVFMRYNR
jgi:hypothetical protein